jgi:hypothetical protein
MRHPGYDCPAPEQSGRCPVPGCPYGKGHLGPRSEDAKHRKMRSERKAARQSQAAKVATSGSSDAGDQ